MQYKFNFRAYNKCVAPYIDKAHADLVMSYIGLNIDDIWKDSQYVIYHVGRQAIWSDEGELLEFLKQNINERAGLLCPER